MMNCLRGFFLCLLTGLFSAAGSANSLVTSVVAKYSSLDPVYATISENIFFVGSLFESLVWVNEKGEPIPAQSSGWEISEDGLIYTLYLREDARWSDGMPVIAADFVSTFRRIVEPVRGTQAKLGYLLTKIRNVPAALKGDVPPEDIGISAVDEHTLRFELSSPTSYFLHILAYPGLAPTPTHLLQEGGVDSWLETLPFVSNGLYVLDAEPSAGAAFTLRKNEFYHDEVEFDTVNVKVIHSRSEALRLFVANELDFVQDTEQKQYDWLKTSYPLTSKTINAQASTYLLFNTRRPEFSQAAVRRALSMAIDRPYIKNRMDGSREGTEASLFSPPDLLERDAEDLPLWVSFPMSERFKRARQILAEHGYDSQNPLVLNVSMLDRNESINIATLLKSMLANIGVVLEINVMVSDQFGPHMFEHQFDVSLVSWNADYPDAMSFLELFRTDGAKNYGNWSNARYDEYLEKSLVEVDVKKRAAYYLELEKIMMNEAPIIPLRYPTRTIVNSNKVEVNYSALTSVIIKSITVSQ